MYNSLKSVLLSWRVGAAAQHTNIRQALWRGHRANRAWLALLAAGLLATLVGQRSTAFKPEEETFGHTMITRSVLTDGFSTWTPGTALIEEALSDGRVLGFAPEAVEQLLMGVQGPDFLLPKDVFSQDASDAGVHISPEFYLPIAHCDNEFIAECADRIQSFLYAKRGATIAAGTSEDTTMPHDGARELLRRAALLLLPDDASAGQEKQAERLTIEARVHFGRALHTLQDLYAHSNWAENHLSSNTTFEQVGQPDGSVSVEKVRALSWSRPANVPQSSGVQTCAPNALTIPAGVIPNYTNTGGNFALTPDSGQKVTTGYFSLVSTIGVGIGTADDGVNARCDHGLEPQVAGLIPIKVAGINKDAPYSPFTPEPQIENGKLLDVANASKLHRQASRSAAKHTHDLIKTFIGELRKMTSAEIGLGAGASVDQVNQARDLMIQLFMGGASTLFVVDATGSMQDIIDGLATQVGRIAADEAAADLQPGRKYMLMTYTETNNKLKSTWHRFADGKVGGTTSLFGSAAAVTDKIKKDLSEIASGGGDCPEPTMDAILEAVARATRRSHLYVFTDASSKDEPDANGVKPSDKLAKIVKAKRLQVTFSLSGSCSPIDPNFARLAEQSGGQVLLVDHLGADTSVAVGGIQAGARDLQAVRIESGSLVGTRSLSIPVEAGAAALSLSATIGSGTVSVINPSGVLQASQGFLGGKTLQVSKPAPGYWQVVYQAAGAAPVSYSLNAAVAGLFVLDSVAYSEIAETGRAGHELHLPHVGQVPAETVRVRALLKGPVAVETVNAYRFDALAQDGSSLGVLALGRVSNLSYEGVADLGLISAGGQREWRVAVSGVDNRGYPFARVMPVRDAASRYLATVSRQPGHWVAGGEHEVTVAVKNTGLTGPITMSARTSIGTVVSATSSIVAVPAAGGNIVVKVRMPAAAAAGDSGAITLALNEQGAAVQSAIPFQLQVPIQISRDSDGDGVPDEAEMGPSGTDANYDGNGDGLPDWKQANVVSFRSAQGIGYLTASADSGRFEAAGARQADELRTFIYDLFAFRLAGLTPGSSAVVKLYLPVGRTASGYKKFGPEPKDRTEHWYEFSDDGTTGYSIAGNVLTLRLKDGARGDDDLTADGVIVDAGGPTGVSLVAQAAAPAVTPTPTPATTPAASGGGGGGGCTLGAPGQHDGSLVLLTALAAGMLWRRRLQGRSPARNPTQPRRH